MNDVDATVPVPPQSLRCLAAKAVRIAACARYGEDSAQCIAAKVAEGIACAPRLPPGGGGDDDDPGCPEGSIPKHIAGSDVCCYEYSEIWEDGILVVECDTNPN